MKTDRLVLEHTYNATPEKLWRALTDFTEMKKWYFPQLESFRPEPGFKTEFNVHHDGKDFLHIWTVTEAIPLHKIAYEWQYDGFPGNSLLTFDLEAREGKTHLTLTHDRLDSFEPQNNPALSIEQFRQGWTHFIAALEKFVA